MTTTDLFPAHQVRQNYSALPAIVTALVLVLLLGIPALTASKSRVVSMTWHGNSAQSSPVSQGN